MTIVTDLLARIEALPHALHEELHNFVLMLEGKADSAVDQAAVDIDAAAHNVQDVANKVAEEVK